MSSEHKCHKFMSTLLVLMMLATGVVLMCEQTDNVSAAGAYQTITVNGDAADGYLSHAFTTVSNTTSQEGYVTYGTLPSQALTYLSFNYSVPADAVVESITISFFAHRQAPGFFYPIRVYSCDWGDALDTYDYDCGLNNGSYLTSFVPNYGSDRIQIDFPTTSVTGSSRVQIELNHDGAYSSANKAMIGMSEYPYTDDVRCGPLMFITYWLPSAIQFELNGGGVYNSFVYPAISDYNTTHQMLTATFDTWTGVNNVSLWVESDWTLVSYIPSTTSTTRVDDVITLYGVVSPATYRLVFIAPYTRECDVHVSYFVSSTGEGLSFETFQIKYHSGVPYNDSLAIPMASADVVLPYGQQYSFGVVDYFGNVISTRSTSILSSSVYITIPLDINSFKVFNQKDDFTKMRVYYPGTEDPLSFYTAPMEAVERFLRDGNYTVSVTFYDNHTATSTEWFNITIDDAEFLMVEGDTISRVISDVAGVNALQQIITTMMTPNVLSVGEDMPSVPNDAFDAGIEMVHPWSIVHGFANGTEFNNETLFYYTYYTSRKYYEVALTLENADGVDWTNVTWFIGFPENRTIDYASVRVYDINNDAYLVSGLHYDMTLSGVRMKWSVFNDSVSRSFRITMYDANASSGGGLAIATASEYAASKYGDEAMYLATARWTNTFSYAYSGQLQVRLDFAGYENIDPSSVVIYDRNTGRELSTNEYTVGGGVITIGSVNAAIGEVYAVDVYFKLDMSDASDLTMTSPILGYPIWLWFLCGGIVCILALFAADGKFIRGKGGWKKIKVNDTVAAIILVLAAIFFILWYLMSVGVV